jgi:hypothetical protein
LVFYVIAVIIATTGFGMIISGVRRERRGRRDLAGPFRPSVGDEAEVWLRRQ